MSNTNQPLAYIPLPLLISELLGNEHHVDIEHKTAAIISSVKGYNEYCHIQYEDHYGERLAYPRLWILQKWRESVDNYRLTKQRADRERVQWHCLQENKTSIKRALTRKFPFLTEEQANNIALRWLNKGEHEALPELNVTLKLTEEDLLK